MNVSRRRLSAQAPRPSLQRLRLVFRSSPRSISASDLHQLGHLRLLRTTSGTAIRLHTIFQEHGISSISSGTLSGLMSQVPGCMFFGLPIKMRQGYTVSESYTTPIKHDLSATGSNLDFGLPHDDSGQGCLLMFCPSLSCCGTQLTFQHSIQSLHLRVSKLCTFSSLSHQLVYILAFRSRSSTNTQVLKHTCFHRATAHIVCFPPIT